MKITASQLRKIILAEGCGCGTCDTCAAGGVHSRIPKPKQKIGSIPHQESYHSVRMFLQHNPDLVNMAVNKLMQMAGSSCPMSTKRAVSDHLSSGDYLPPAAIIMREGLGALISKTSPRYAAIFKAKDRNFYIDIADHEGGQWEDSTSYGPFSSDTSARSFLNENFDNPGDVLMDDSGETNPPAWSPNGKPVQYTGN